MDSLEVGVLPGSLPLRPCHTLSRIVWSDHILPLSEGFIGLFVVGYMLRKTICMLDRMTSAIIEKYQPLGPVKKTPSGSVLKGFFYCYATYMLRWRAYVGWRAVWTRPQRRKINISLSLFALYKVLDTNWFSTIKKCIALGILFK